MTKAMSTGTKMDSKKDSKPAKKKPKLNLKKVSLEREPLSHAGGNREACNKCGRARSGCALFRMPEVPADFSQRLLVVVEGSESSRTRRFLRRTWRAAGWRDRDIAVVPAIRCGTATPSMAQLRACRPFLLQVIHKLKPKNILGLGSVAMRALRNAGETNLTKNRGKEIRIPGL